MVAKPFPKKPWPKSGEGDALTRAQLKIKQLESRLYRAEARESEEMQRRLISLQQENQRLQKKVDFLISGQVDQDINKESDPQFLKAVIVALQRDIRRWELIANERLSRGYISIPKIRKPPQKTYPRGSRRSVASRREMASRA